MASWKGAWPKSEMACEANGGGCSDSTWNPLFRRSNWNHNHPLSRSHSQGVAWRNSGGGGERRAFPLSGNAECGRSASQSPLDAR